MKEVVSLDLEMHLGLMFVTGEQLQGNKCHHSLHIL
jgi:hypothetical protein